MQAISSRLGGSCLNGLQAKGILQGTVQIGVEAVDVAQFACMVNGPNGYVVAVTLLGDDRSRSRGLGSLPNSPEA